MRKRKEEKERKGDVMETGRPQVKMEKERRNNVKEGGEVCWSI